MQPAIRPIFHRAGTNWSGLPPDVTVDRLQDWFERVHPDDIGDLRRIVTAKPEGERQHFEHEHRLRHEKGDYMWVYARGVILADERGKAVRMAGSISSIAKRKETEHQLIHRALHDALTGLPNRVLFTDRLQQALRRFKRNNDLRFAVLYFDLDRFKFVNDSLGHSAGDSLLVSVARRLMSVIRPGDTVARMGGDEFAVLVSDIEDESDTAQVTERIHTLFQQEFSIAGRGMYYQRQHRCRHCDQAVSVTRRTAARRGSGHVPGQALGDREHRDLRHHHAPGGDFASQHGDGPAACLCAR